MPSSSLRVDISGSWLITGCEVKSLKKKINPLMPKAATLLVFSVITTLLGYPDAILIPETSPISLNNSYGRTKITMEQMLAYVQSSALER